MRRSGRDGLRQRARAVRLWARRKIPPGLRLVAGLVLIVGGVFGFLPVLGFWMIPLGLGIIWLDFRALRKFRRSPGSDPGEEDDGEDGGEEGPGGQART